MRSFLAIEHRAYTSIYRLLQTKHDLSWFPTEKTVFIIDYTVSVVPSRPSVDHDNGTLRFVPFAL